MVLENIQLILEKEEFECSLFFQTDQNPFDRLIVFLGLDPLKREKILEIIAAQQQLSPEFMLPQAVELPYRLHFQVQLPFDIQDLALNQVASLLFFINQFIDLPGFELNELESKVYYRYVWIISPSAINNVLIMSILGSIMLNISLFSHTIESLAKAEASFNDLLSQIVKMADHLPNQPSKKI